MFDGEYKGWGIMASSRRADKMRKGDCVPTCGFIRLVVWGLVMVLVLLLLAGCAGQQGSGKKEEQASKAQPSDPAEVIDAFTEAIIAHDVEGALDQVNEDAAVYGGPRVQLKGKEEIRRYIEGLVDRDVHIELLGERQVEGEQVSWQSRVSLSDLENEVINNAEAIVRDGKIVTYNIRP